MAPIPPQVAASEGPIKIQTPKHDATKEAVKDLFPKFLSAEIYEEIEVFPLDKKIPTEAKTILTSNIVIIVTFLLR